MLKPDALKRCLMGKIITRIEEKGWVIKNMKMMILTEGILKEHYAHLSNEPFFPEIVSFMTSGPVLGMIVEGEGVIDGIRKLMGPTKWYEAVPGTIRGDYASNTTYNLIHGSDSIKTAEAEIKRFFGK
jgi:nucleoside-diphosphate kinase